MAKKKFTPIAPQEFEEIIGDELEVETDIEAEEVVIEEAEEIVVSPEVETIPVEIPSIEEKRDTKNDLDQFIHTQLKVLNMMPNQAKARRLAERVLRNRKGL